MTEYKEPVHFMGKRRRVVVNTGTETLVEQCHAETTNINKIIARYRRSGGLPPAPEANYLDVSNIGDLMDVKLAFTDMQQAYDELPEIIKERLPFADISNIDDDSLKELFEDVYKPADKKPDEKAQPGDTKSEEKPEGGETSNPPPEA